MKILNPTLLQEFIKKAGRDLTGEWLLVGGTLLPAVGLMIRSTVDIDLIGLGEKGAAQSLQLMDLAASLGLSIESINQAAAFFLKQVPHTKKDYLILHQGKSATIYRPSVALYWRLKTQRMTDSDALDCQHYYQYCRGQGDPVDAKTLKSIVQVALDLDITPEKYARLKNLMEII